MAWWLFQNLVVIAVLAAAVVVVSRVTRLGPVARHALWVVVLLKFVTPPLVVWPWPMPDPLGLSAAQSSLPASVAAPDAPADSAPGESISAVDSGQVMGSDATESAGQTPAESPSLVSWLVGIWIAGSVILMLIEGTRLIRHARRIRQAVPADADLEYRVARLCARLDLRPVPVVVVPGAVSPAVWCVGRPRILWPADLPADASDACKDGLLVHELAHVKRHDHLVGWVELAAGIIWWWNPLFWFVRSALREQAELACDAWVISALPNGRRAYAESLLALSAEAIRGAPSMAVVAMRANSRRVLERRLVMIMKGRAPLRLPWVGLFTLAVMASATLPAWATTQQAPPPPPPPPTPVVVPAEPPRPATAAPAPAARARRVPADQQTPPPPPPPAVAPVPVEVRPDTPRPSRVTPRERPVTAAPARVQTPQTPPAPPVPMRPSDRRIVATVPAPIDRAPAAPPAVAAPRMRSTPQAAPPTPPPAPARVATPSVPQAQRRVTLPSRDLTVNLQPNLPADGRALLADYTRDRAAIQQEADQKMQARHNDLIKELTDLQERYTRAGRLDEALQVRDYIRSLGGRQIRR